MPVDFLRPDHELKSLLGYHLPGEVADAFPERVFRPVELRLAGRRMLCRCGRTEWSMAWQAGEFVCECPACGARASFGLHCFGLFEVRVMSGPDIIDVDELSVLYEREV